MHKANKLINNIFKTHHIQHLQNNININHIHYPTTNNSNTSKTQPFYINSPYNITLTHNNNLTNTHKLHKKLFKKKHHHINTTSNSKILLNIFTNKLNNFHHYPLKTNNIFTTITTTNHLIHNTYTYITIIINHNIITFHNPNKIHPLILKKHNINKNHTKYIITSKNITLNTLNFNFLHNITPNKTIYITKKKQLFTHQYTNNPINNPYLFKYIYFTHPNSFINKISIYNTHININTKLNKKITHK